MILSISVSDRTIGTIDTAMVYGVLGTRHVAGVWL